MAAPGGLNLTANGAGDYWCIDLAPLPEGHVGQIISFSHESSPDCVIATSFQTLLATFVDELEAGRYVIHGWTLAKEEEDTW